MQFVEASKRSSADARAYSFVQSRINAVPQPTSIAPVSLARVMRSGVRNAAGVMSALLRRCSWIVVSRTSAEAAASMLPSMFVPGFSEELTEIVEVRSV